MPRTGSSRRPTSGEGTAGCQPHAGSPRSHTEERAIVAQLGWIPGWPRHVEEPVSSWVAPCGEHAPKSRAWGRGAIRTANRRGGVTSEPPGVAVGPRGWTGLFCVGDSPAPPAPSRPHSRHTHPWVHDLARTAASSVPTRLAVLKGPRCEHNCVSVPGPVTRWSRRCGGARAGGEGGAPVAGVALWSSFCLLHAKGQKCGRDTTDDKMYPISGA